MQSYQLHANYIIIEHLLLAYVEARTRGKRDFSFTERMWWRKKLICKPTNFQYRKKTLCKESHQRCIWKKKVIKVGVHKSIGRTDTYMRRYVWFPSTIYINYVPHKLYVHGWSYVQRSHHYQPAYGRRKEILSLAQATFKPFSQIDRNSIRF